VIFVVDVMRILRQTTAILWFINTARVVALFKANDSVTLQLCMVILVFFFVTILVDKQQTWFFVYIWRCLSSAIYGRPSIINSLLNSPWSWAWSNQNSPWIKAVLVPDPSEWQST